MLMDIANTIMPAINKKDASIYEVESHTKGNFYTVDIDAKTCTCPHYQFRMKRFGGECKHIVAVRDFIAANSEVKEYKSKYKSNRSVKPAKSSKSNKKETKKTDSSLNDLTAEILKEVGGEEGKDAIELIDKYGEFLINDLITKGYLIESKGKIKLMR